MSTNLQSFNRSRVGAFTQSELGARNAAGRRILIWNIDGFHTNVADAIKSANLAGMDVQIDAAIEEGEAQEWSHNLDDYTVIHYENWDARFYTRPEWYGDLLAKKWRGRLFWRCNTGNASAKEDANTLAETTHIPTPVRLAEVVPNRPFVTKNAVSFSNPLTKGVDPFPMGVFPHGRVKGGFRLGGIPRENIWPSAESDFGPWTEDVPFVSESSNGRFSVILHHGFLWHLNFPTVRGDGSFDFSQSARFFRNLYEVDI